MHIIFIFKGYQDYLYFVIKQAKKFNPRAVIHLIGDETNRQFSSLAHFHHLQDYFTQAAEFEKHYKHININPYKFALFTFQRWFVLKDFIFSNNIKESLYLDSDVMIYCDVQEEYRKLKEFDFTISKWSLNSDHSSTHCLFLNNTEMLDKFCNFLMQFYKQKNIIVTTKHKNKLHFCEMTALELFCRNNRYQTVNIAEITDRSVYDHSINGSAQTDSTHFKMSRGIKKIEFINGLPYGTVIESGEKIRFKILHFQGKAKKYLKKFYSE